MRHADRTVDTQSQREFVSTLRRLAEVDSRALLEDNNNPILSAFVTRRQEHIRELVTPTAGLVIVIEGLKEVYDGSEHRLYTAGNAFVVTPGTRLDVVNEPDAQSGFYRALFVQFSRELIIKAARLWPQFVGRGGQIKSVRVSAALCSAILHGAQVLSHTLSASPRVIEHRILEVLLILAEQGVLPLVPKYVDGSVIEAFRLLIRHRLHLPWTAAKVAKELSLSEATLRRRLRAEGQTLREVLRVERMKAAYMILHDRNADVADALAATGYRSRSHFSRHFQQRYGFTPSTIRRQKYARVND